MPTRPSRLVSDSSLALRIVLLCVLLATAGCVGGAWKRALEEDTPSAYHRFLRDHPDSRYEEVARERLDFHKVQRRPTLAGFESFRRKYPDSELIAVLHPMLEKPAFDVARAQGTADAYRDFLEGFGDGALAARARGNALYIESRGFGGDPVALAEFAKSHPESDFAAEAERSAQAVAEWKVGRIDRVGLVLEIAATTPEAKRVRQAFLDRIGDLTQQLGMQIVLIPEVIAPGQTGRFPAARLEITHRERPVETKLSRGDLSSPARLGETRVVLRDRPGGEVIASRRFELRVEEKAYVPGTSVLFSAVAPKFWAEFFVPVAHWRNDRSIRPPIALDAPVVDIDGVGDRAVVLYENGDFDLIGLADPMEPVELGTYRRSEHLKKWSGVRVLGSRVAIFGEEGLEIVAFSPGGPVAQASWGRGEIGRVLSVAQVGTKLVITGAKGMQVLDPATGEIRRVMRRAVLSLATTGDVLFFVDGESVYVSDLARLAQNRVIAQMKLGKTFGPRNVRVQDGAAIVTGPGGALVIDVKNPQAPRALAKLSSLEVGEVFDATRIGGRTFLVGQRGLQLLDPGLTRVEETIDVGERSRVSVMGRHLVTADATSLQVVDATPWAQASPRSSRTQAPADGLLDGRGF